MMLSGLVLESSTGATRRSRAMSISRGLSPTLPITISVARSRERARARTTIGIRVWSAAGTGSGLQTVSKAMSRMRFLWGSGSSS